MCDMDISLDGGYDYDIESTSDEGYDYDTESISDVSDVAEGDLDSYDSVDFECETTDELDSYESVEFDDCEAVAENDGELEYVEDIDSEDSRDMEQVQEDISEDEENKEFEEIREGFEQPIQDDYEEVEDWMTVEGFEELIKDEADIEFLNNLRERIIAEDISIKDSSDIEEDSPKVLTRGIALELQENSEYGDGIEDTEFLQEDIGDYQEESAEAEEWMTIEGFEELIKNETDVEFLDDLREDLISGEISIRDNSRNEEDISQIFTREFDSEIQETSEYESNLFSENFEEGGFSQENIEDYEEIGFFQEDVNSENFEERDFEEVDVTEAEESMELEEGESVEEFEEIIEENEVKENIQEDFETKENDNSRVENIEGMSLDMDENNSVNDISDNSEYEMTREFAEAEDFFDETEEINSFENGVKEIEEIEINYDEIYEQIQQEALEQSFVEIDIDADPERLEGTLNNFEESTWEKLSLDEQKESMKELYDYISECVGFDNPPKIEYYNNERAGEYGGYNAATNTLSINEYMLYNSTEAADTIAHELWHAHQHECAMNPKSARDFQYQYNFENYITPDLGQKEYESQLVEAEARAFAAQFKDRLSEIRGRR